MKLLELVGGRSAEPGTYREVHSGHVVHVYHDGVLPGQCNSEVYVRVPEREDANVHLPSVKNEQG